MRKVKEVLRLAWLEQFSDRQIAGAANMKRSTVRDYLARAQARGLSWPQVAGMPHDELAHLLFPPAPGTRADKPLPDWRVIHQELRRKHVTLQLLWEEYAVAHPSGYRYSQFCELYHRFVNTLEVSMRQTHVPGEKLFVDYSGTRMPVVDPTTGEVRWAELFIAVFGASNYTFAEATWSQKLPDWIGSHVRALQYFGGVPEQIVPDNLKSAVRHASFYDPEINPTYQRWAEHYGVAILPARVRHPKDKSKVELGVQFVQRWILAALRTRTFFSLVELNAAIGDLLERMNTRPFRKMAGSRAALFAAVDAPALRPLPHEPYEYEEWKNAKVNIDYHIAFDDHFYSVPHHLVRQPVAVRATARTIEIFHRDTRVAVHARSDHRYKHTTLTAHMPQAHRTQAEWTPERIASWGRTAGADVAALFTAIMARKAHPVHGFRTCLGIMRLEEKVGRARLNAACRRALAVGSMTAAGVRTILEHRQDELPLPEVPRPLRIIVHENVRGAAYYQQEDREPSPSPEVRHAAASHA